MEEAEALQQRVYLLDQIQGQRGGLGENIDVYAVNRVFQDQTADVEPPGGRKSFRSNFSHSNAASHGKYNEKRCIVALLLLCHRVEKTQLNTEE